MTEAGTRYLPKGRRIAFVGRTRNLIERKIGSAGPADAARVREVLARLGEPADLVMAERDRLYAERIKRQSPAKGTGDADAAEVTAPLQLRPVNSGRRPAAQVGSPRSQPSTGQGDAGQGDAGQNRPAARPGAAEEGKRKSRLGGLLLDWPGRKGAQPGAQASRQSAPPSPAGAAGQAPAGTAGQAPGGVGTEASGGVGTEARGGTSTWGPAGGGGSAHQQPAGWATSAAAGARQAASAVPAGGSTRAGGTSALSHGTRKLRDAAVKLGHAAAQLALAAARLARRYPLESVAVVLLGIGGLILPFPFWLLGGLLAIWSRLWNARDKWVALAGPPGIALVGMVVTALIVGGRGHVITVYVHALRLDLGYLLRAGSVLCAGYLVLQMRRGPQRRLPPWRR